MNISPMNNEYKWVKSETNFYNVMNKLLLKSTRVRVWIILSPVHKHKKGFSPFIKNKILWVCW
jgi:hypothetical protein